MTEEKQRHCDSGNKLTEDGTGLCLRAATHTVEFSQSRGGVRRTKKFLMCKSCAGHWVTVHPKTVRILDTAEVSA